MAGGRLGGTGDDNGEEKSDPVVPARFALIAVALKVYLESDCNHSEQFRLNDSRRPVGAICCAQGPVIFLSVFVSCARALKTIRTQLGFS